MITKQLKACMKVAPISFNSTFRKFGIEGKDLNGNVIYITSFTSSYLYTNVSISSSTSIQGIILGSGTTPPTEDDYCLESRITTGLSIVSSLAVIDNGIDNNNNLQSIISVTLRNTTSADIVINEIGMVTVCYGNTVQGTSPGQKYILIDRTVLNAPLIVPANGTASLEYKFTSIEN